MRGTLETKNRPIAFVVDCIRRGLRWAKSREWFLGISGVMLLFGAWWLGAIYVASHYDRSQVLLPSPADVVRDFRDIAVFRGPNTPPTVGNAVVVILENTRDSV